MITHNYQELISVGNLFQAWSEFRKGKRKRKDVQIFERNLEDNLFGLYQLLKEKSYQHGKYQSFYVHDPKQRHIHKAEVSDRIIHHLLYKYLYQIFDKTFIYDSYSCRLEKGIHKGVLRLEQFVRKVSKNYTRPCWALKLDIKKFFANIDHAMLLHLLNNRIKDKDVLWLMRQVISSFHSEAGIGKGIPLGNLTSQVFANVYMNKLDQFIKHTVRVNYYLRYADDFLLLSNTKEELERRILPMSEFIQRKLKLELHPSKIIFRRLDWGIDFLGYVVLPYYILPRTRTKRRIFKKLKEKIDLDNFYQSLASYLGYLSHASSFKVAEELKNMFYLNGEF